METKSIKKRNSYLLRTYGLDQETYDLLLTSQGGCCGCCGTDKPGHTDHFVVDHDHRTGCIRGLLCHSCNIGIGKLGDDSDGIRKALAYLIRFDVSQ